MECVIEACNWYLRGDMTFAEVECIARVNQMMVVLLPNDWILVHNPDGHPIKSVA